MGRSAPWISYHQISSVLRVRIGGESPLFLSQNATDTYNSCGVPIIFNTGLKLDWNCINWEHLIFEKSIFYYSASGDAGEFCTARTIKCKVVPWMSLVGVQARRLS